MCACACARVRVWGPEVLAEEEDVRVRLRVWVMTHTLGHEREPADGPGLIRFEPDLSLTDQPTAAGQDRLTGYLDILGERPHLTSFALGCERAGS